MSDLAPSPPITPADSGTRAFARQAAIALTAFLTVVDLFATQAILPSLAHAYSVSPASMSLAVNASTLGMAVASLGTAFLAQRIDQRRGILTSLACLSIPTLLLAVAPGLTVFALLRIVQGIFMASAFTLTLAYLGERSAGAGCTAGAFAAYITGNVASNLFGRLISAGLADHLGLPANFIVFAGLNLLGAALVFFTVERAPARRTAMPPLSAPAAIAMHLRNPALLAAFAIGFCILFAFIGTFSFVNFVLVREPLGLGMMALGLVYFVFLPSILTTPLAGRLVARFGPRPPLWGGLGIAAFGLPLLLSATIPPVVTGLGLVAVGTFLAQAVVTGFVGRAAATARGAASGIYLCSYFSGGLIGTAILGPVFDAAGWGACVAGVACALAAASILAAGLKRPA